MINKFQQISQNGTLRGLDEVLKKEINPHIILLFYIAFRLRLYSTLLPLRPTRSKTFSDVGIAGRKGNLTLTSFEFCDYGAYLIASYAAIAY